jgi:hypothetical protein
VKTAGPFFFFSVTERLIIYDEEIPTRNCVVGDCRIINVDSDAGISSFKGVIG